MYLSVEEIFIKNLINVLLKVLVCLLLLILQVENEDFLL